MKPIEKRKARNHNVIMVADDDPLMRSLLKQALHDVGDVIEADAGYRIVEHYRRHLPDIVLLDIHLPDKDGKLVLQELLAYDRDAYVVMVSGDSASSNVKQTLHTGAKGFVCKPFHRSALMKYLLQCPTLSLNDLLGLEGVGA